MPSVELVTPLTPRRSSRRDHWTPGEAHRVLADVAGSGLRLAAHARKHGLREQQIYWWNSRLRNHVDAAPPTRGPMTFVPVVQVRGPAASADGGIEAWLGDVSLQLRRDFAPTPLYCTPEVKTLVGRLFDLAERAVLRDELAQRNQGEHRGPQATC